jgi:hypothetical protein
MFRKKVKTYSDKNVEELKALIQEQFAKIGCDTPEKRELWWKQQGLEPKNDGTFLYISPECLEKISTQEKGK